MGMDFVYKKRILCYGDSHTWWYVSWTNHQRYPSTHRRTWLLQEKLWTAYVVIEEWLNSRTLISNDPRPWKEWRKWSEYLLPCLDSHDPLDLVVLMLWTNELKYGYWLQPDDIVQILEDEFVNVILSRWSQSTWKIPKLLLLSPPNMDESTQYANMRYKWWTKKNIVLELLYAWLAKKYNISYINTQKITTPWIDWVHFDEESHISLADTVYEHILEFNL